MLVIHTLMLPIGTIFVLIFPQCVSIILVSTPANVHL